MRSTQVPRRSSCSSTSSTCTGPSTAPAGPSPPPRAERAHWLDDARACCSAGSTRRTLWRANARTLHAYYTPHDPRARPATRPPLRRAGGARLLDDALVGRHRRSRRGLLRESGAAALLRASLGLRAGGADSAAREARPDSAQGRRDERARAAGGRAADAARTGRSAAARRASTAGRCATPGRARSIDRVVRAARPGSVPVSAREPRRDLRRRPTSSCATASARVSLRPVAVAVRSRRRAGTSSPTSPRVCVAGLEAATGTATGARAGAGRNDEQTREQLRALGYVR